MTPPRGWLFVVIALALCTAPKRSHACECASRPSVQQAVLESSSVFVGAVVSITDVELSSDNGTIPMRRVILHVDRAWRGAIGGDEVSVVTGRTQSSCGFPFVIHRSYLVYASQRDRDGLVTLCSRTQSIELAHGDIEALGAPSSTGSPAPTEGIATIVARPPHRESSAPNRGGCASCTTVPQSSDAAPHAALLLFASWLIATTRRRRNGLTAVRPNADAQAPIDTALRTSSPPRSN